MKNNNPIRSKYLRLSVIATATLLMAACNNDDADDFVAGIVGPDSACTAVSPLPSGLPVTVTALTEEGKLLQFTPGGSSSVSSLKTISGLQAGESIIGIDYRPADGKLVALAKSGNVGQLYTINTTNGQATLIPRMGTNPLTLAGTRYGIDFNPVPGALRIISDNEENYRLVFSPDFTSYTVNIDTPLNPAANVISAAYTNSFTGAAVTTLYGLDSVTDNLVLQGGVDGATNPNSGVLSTVGPLGVNFGERAGFDIDGVTGTGIAALNVAGTTSTGIYAINLATGSASCLGTVPAPKGQLVTDIAIPTPAPAIAYGLTTSNQLVSFRPNAAGVSSLLSGPTAITGLGLNETIVGMDIRPKTGALTIVTRNTVTNAGAVYEVNRTTAAATLKNPNAGQTLSFTAGATVFGVDFNPVPNALRIVNNANDNIRLTFPADTAGYNVVTDVAITPAAQNSAAAYTNNFDGTTSTRLYVIDTTSNQLKYQNPPNAGTQVVVGSLGIITDSSNSAMDIIGGSGVNAALATDIGTNVGNTVTYAALTVGGSSNLYRINLQSGAATQVGTTPIGGTTPLVLKGLAVLVSK